MLGKVETKNSEPLTVTHDSVKRVEQLQEGRRSDDQTTTTTIGKEEVEKSDEKESEVPQSTLNSDHEGLTHKTIQGECKEGLEKEEEQLAECESAELDLDVEPSLTQTTKAGEITLTKTTGEEADEVMQHTEYTHVSKTVDEKNEISAKETEESKENNSYKRDHSAATVIEKSLSKDVQEIGEIMETKKERVKETVQTKKNEVTETMETKKVTESVEVNKQEVTETVETKKKEVTETVNAKKKEVTETVEARKKDVTETVEAKKKEVTETVEAKKYEVTKTVEAKIKEVTETANAKKKEVTETVEARKKDVTETVEAKKKEITETVEAKKKEVTETVETMKKEVTETVETRKKEVTETANAKKKEVTETVEAKKMEVTEAIETNKLLVTEAIGEAESQKEVLLADAEESKSALLKDIEKTVAEHTEIGNQQMAEMKKSSKQSIQAMTDAKEKADKEFISAKKSAQSELASIEREIKDKKMKGFNEVKKMEKILIENVMKMDLGLNNEKNEAENEIEKMKMILDDESDDIESKIVNAFSNNCEIISKESKDELNIDDKLSFDSPEEKAEKDKFQKEKRDSKTYAIIKDIKEILEDQVSSGKVPNEDGKFSSKTCSGVTLETSNVSSKEDSKSESTETSNPAVITAVPFLYYVTPKQFRSRNSASDLEKNAQQERELQRMKSRAAIQIPDSDSLVTKSSDVESEHANEIEEQRKAGFFSLPRMVDPSEAYSAEEAKESETGTRSHFSLPRFISPKSMKPTPDSSTSSPSRSGLTRLKNFLLRRDSSKFESKDEDFEQSSKTDNASETKDSPVVLHQNETITASAEQTGKKVVVSKKKRHLFNLGRLHHSEDISSSEGDLSGLPDKGSAIPQETKTKSSSLTRPRSLWFGNKENKDKDSPIVLETIPISVVLTKPSDEPLCGGGDESKQRKQRINLSLKGIGKTKEKESKEAKNAEESANDKKRSSVAPDEKVEVLPRSPSYEMAISSHDYDDSPKKSVFETGSTRLKQLFKNQSVTLRNTFSRSNNFADKRKSCPAGTISDTPWAPLSGSGVNRSSAPDITDRHPSISTFIDDTPVAGSPPTVTTDTTTTTTTTKATAVVVSDIAPAKPIEGINNTGTFATTDTAAASAIIDPDEPPHYPPPSIPSSPSKGGSKDVDVESIDVSSSDDDDDDFSEQLTGRPDWSESLEQNLRSTLERKLTFSLPPGAPDSSGADAETAGVRSVERAIEARQQSADYIGSMVRCLHLSKCFIANSELVHPYP